MPVTTAYRSALKYASALPLGLDEPDIQNLTKRMRQQPDVQALGERVLEALDAAASQAFPQTFVYQLRGEDTLDSGNPDVRIKIVWPGLVVESLPFRHPFEATLEIAVEMGDETAFVRAAERVDWSQRPAVDFVRTVHLALAAGAHLLARNLATQGAKLYPDHSELRKMAHVLAPPRVVNADIPPTPAVRANQAWLRDHADEYKGQWVALREGTRLAAGATAREVWDRLESTDGVMLTKVF